MDEKSNTGIPFKCSYCGAPMSFNDFVCKSCWTDINGNKVDKNLYINEVQEYVNENDTTDIEKEIIEYTCTNCGAELKEEDMVCPKCGADVSEIEEENAEDENDEMINEEGKEKNEKGEIIYICGNCNAVLKQDDKVCPKCGAEVIEEVEELGEKLTCPHCNEVVDVDDDICNACGGELFREIPEDFSQTVVLQTFSDKFEAQLVKELLGANGIEAYVSVDNEGDMMPSLNMNGARLLILDKDLEKALEIINTPGEEMEKDSSEEKNETDT
jgi:RNA polymerase subunit RPABC4/transcription elongation factor Spt4